MSMNDIEQRKARMAKACAARLREADFRGDAEWWGKFLADVYYEPVPVVHVPVGLSALVVSREGRMELTKAGVSWIEEAERRWVEKEVASEKCEVRSGKEAALPGWAERAVSRPDRRENEGRAIARELDKVRKLAAGYGRKWEAKVAARAARWISSEVASGKCDVRSEEGERGAM